MPVFRRVSLLMLLLLTPCAHAVGGESVARIPAPGWAKVSEFEPLPDAGADKGSSHYLLADYQVNIEEDAAYEHLVVQLLTEEGVKNFSQLDFEYQPEYQQLEIHHIRIIRDGVVRERLDGATFETIRREEGMHEELFDGTVTAYTILEDVRPGDILSYAFTTRGQNPIFSGRQHDFIRLRFGTPIDFLRRRLLWNPNVRELRWQTLGREAIAPIHRPGSPLHELEWTLRDSPRVEAEDDTPGWFFDYPWLEWSDYRDWAAFGDWALGIYQEPGSLPEELVAVCGEIRAASATPEQEIVNTLRWVQRNVRYLGSFLGEHTHAPHALSLILRRRFGDCKDKGVLTVAMLRHLGHDAAPALVNTSRRKSVSEYLPGHACFDHLIVHLVHAGEDFFLDPTHTFQRGPLEHLDLPDYGFAFLVRPNQTGLHPLKPRGKSVAGIRIEEFYQIKSMRGEAFLKVRTVATGTEANNLRRVFADDPLPEISESYLKFYEQAHPGIETASPIEFEDDEEKNRFETREHYRIPAFWGEPGEDGGETEGKEVRARVLATSLNYPDKQERKHPHWISHPKNITQVVDVTFPESWTTEEDSKTIRHPAFEYHGTVTPRADGYRSDHRYTSLAAEVQAEDFDSYGKAMDELSDDLSLYLTREDGADAAAAEAAPASDFSYLLVGVTAVTGLIAGLGLAVWMHFHDPAPPLSLPQDPRGLGGWMILPLLGTIIAPVLLAVSAYSYFGNLSEMAHTLDAESGFGIWRQYYVAGTFGNTLMLIPSLMLIVWMFRKRSCFPLHYSILLGINVVVLAALYALELRIENLDPPADGGVVMKSLLQLMIWGTYMHHSRRVKATFTRRRKYGPPPLAAESPGSTV